MAQPPGLATGQVWGAWRPTSAPAAGPGGLLCPQSLAGARPMEHRDLVDAGAPGESGPAPCSRGGAPRGPGHRARREEGSFSRRYSAEEL